MWFKKEKTRLEQNSEVLEALIAETNLKINELGQYDFALYNALNHIQGLFDKIRNIPSDKQFEYQEIKKVSLSWKQQVDKIENDYETAKKTDIRNGAAGGLLGAGVATLGPAAAMGVATTFGVASTGTAISNLSGAAATNAALAWLGGGALSAGGGGMAAGNFFLGLAGPVGWTIAGIAIVGSLLLFWKSKSDRNRLEELFLLIGERDQCSYKESIVELNERIKRIKDETTKLNDAIKFISTFGTDYRLMTEQQQYALGAYVNLMNASTQLLVNPILGLQSKYTMQNLEDFLAYNVVYANKDMNKDLTVYMANLLYKINTDESDRKLLSKSFKSNREFRKKMGLEKKDINLELFNLVDKILKRHYHN
jgi:hypothetical protein